MLTPFEGMLGSVVEPTSDKKVLLSFSLQLMWLCIQTTPNKGFAKKIGSDFQGLVFN